MKFTFYGFKYKWCDECNSPVKELHYKKCSNFQPNKIPFNMRHSVYVRSDIHYSLRMTNHIIKENIAKPKGIKEYFQSLFD